MLNIYGKQISLVKVGHLLTSLSINISVVVEELCCSVIQWHRLFLFSGFDVKRRGRGEEEEEEKKGGREGGKDGERER